MQDDIFPAAEKILTDVENVVKKNPSLKSFEIVPAEDNENKSPVFHQGDSLGLASWCVQPLYCYVHRRLLEHRRNKHRREEPGTIAKWLVGALLLNPDVTTFWNMRRELVRSHKLELSDELLFTRLVLYHKPKCFEVFAYRRWLLSYILSAKDSDYDPEPAESPLTAELEIATTCADRYASNYHAWSHRRHVMTLRESRGFTYPTVDAEWKSSLAWCQRHVSDYSGFSYRQFLLNKYMFDAKELPGEEPFRKCTDLLGEQWRKELFAYIKSNVSDTRETDRLQRLLDAEPGAIVCPSVREHACLRGLSYWLEECRANDSAICMYNDHEALWCHRRFLAYLLARFAPLQHLCHGDGESNDASLDSLSRDLLVEAFRTRTGKIAELAVKRDHHERMLVERFFKFARTIGLEIKS